MNRWLLTGLILIALGAVGLVVPRITYQEEAASVDLGPVDLEVQEERSFTIPDALAIGVLVIGGIFVAVGTQRSPR